MRRSWGFVFVVSSTLAASGCGGSTPPASAPTSSSSSVPKEDKPEPAAEAAPAEEQPSQKSEQATAPTVEKYVPASAQNRSNQQSSSGYPSEYPSEYGAPSSNNSGNYPTDLAGFVSKMFTLMGFSMSPSSISGNAAIDQSLMKFVGVAPNATKSFSMKDRANAAFTAGNTTRAYDLLVANALLGEEDASSSLADQYLWNALAKKPTLGMRIAVGLNLDNSFNLKDLRPVGTSLQTLSQRVTLNRNGNQGGPGSSGALEGPGDAGMTGYGGLPLPGSQPDKQLTDAAGELSTKLLSEIESVHATGIWGTAFQSQKFAVRRPSLQGGILNANGSMEGYPGGPMPGGYPFPSDGINTRQFFPFQNGGGPAVGALSQAASDGSLIPAGYGPAEVPDKMGYEGGVPAGPGYPPPGPGYPPPGGSFPPGMPGMPPGPPPAAAGADPSDLRLPTGLTPIGTPVDYIGSDSQTKLLQLASEKGYDLLIVFDVEVAFNRRSGIVNNTARARAVIVAEDPKESKVVGSSKSLSAVAVAKARSKSEADGVEDTVKELAQKTAESSKLIPIPGNLTAEGVVKSRLPKLIADSKTTKLNKLGEVQFYYTKGYIDDAQRSKAFSDIASNDGATLLTGSNADKKKAIDRLLSQ